MRAVHSHCNLHTGLPGCARAPMVRIPKVKDSLEPIRTSAGACLSLSLSLCFFLSFSFFLSSATCLSFSTSHLIVRLLSFLSKRANERPRKALMTRSNHLGSPLYNTLNRREIPEYQILFLFFFSSLYESDDIGSAVTTPCSYKTLYRVISQVKDVIIDISHNH